MMLDIPTWTFQDPKAAKAANIHSYQDAVDATHINARYYMANRKGNFKVLNVLQGSNHADADSWYEEFKDYLGKIGWYISPPPRGSSKQLKKIPAFWIA
jgi:hypothetical protein